jgi:hypothetical protein
MSRLLLFIGLIVCSSVFSSPITCPENQCIAVVNAGNSASRLEIYTYNLDVSQAPIDIKNIFSKKIEPGFASIELKKASIGQYLSQLFSEDTDHKIPVYFFATSGMRMLSFSRQQAYYDSLNQWFSKQPNWQLIDAKTLKDREEALFGWLAVNYELGTLTKNSMPLVGMIDTGSASTQIAFPLKSAQAMKSNDNMNIHVYGRHISLFVHGFLGLGQDEIRSQYLDNGDCFPKNYPLPDGTYATGDFWLCEKMMGPLINDIHRVNKFIGTLIQDHSEQAWYVIGGISGMLQERPFYFKNNQFTNQELAEMANQQVCQQDWSMLGILFPKNKYLFANCLSASYFYALFAEGLGIQDNQPIHYISNTTSTNDWTLGAVLYQEGAVKSAPPDDGSKEN